MNASVALMWLLLLPFIAVPVVYLVDRWCLRKGLSPWYGQWLASLVFLVTGYLALVLVRSPESAAGSLWMYISGITLHWDGLSKVVTLTALGLGLMVAVFSGNYLARERASDKYFALLVSMVGAIIGLSIANDLFNLWLWFELMAISSYLLVAFYPQEKASLEAGVKYLVQSAAGSALILLGIALTYAYAGTLQLDGIRARFAEINPALTAAGALFMIGFGVKAALVPLHTWLPDAHAQAPSGISAMLSGIVIEAGLVALLRSLSALGAGATLWGAFLMGFGALNMILGNMLALRQVQVKRLLAFSSVAQVGYMLVGLGIGWAYQQPIAIAGGFFHLLTHALMKGLAFLAVGALLFALLIERGRHEPLTIDDLAGASQRYPLISLTLSIALLGLGGLPPFAGFMSKWQIFVGGVVTRQGWAIELVILAGLNSVLSLGYYAPIVNRLYRRESSELVKRGGKVSATMVIPLIILALAVIALGFVPSLANVLTTDASSSLLLLSGVH